MTVHFSKVIWFITAALLLGGGAAQQDETVQATDMLFVSAASQSNVYEIGAARHGVQQVESQDVKDFAQQIIDDHTMRPLRL